MNFDMSEIFTILAGLFIIIGVGFMAVRLKIVPTSVTPHLSNILMRISLPCTIFTAMIRPYDPQFLTDGLFLMVAAAALIFIYAVVTFGVMYFLPLQRFDRGAWMYSVVFCNAGFIGYPIAIALFGEEGLSLAVIMNAPLMLAAFSWGIYYIRRSSDSVSGARAKWWTVLISECNISLVLSLVFYVNSWTPPELIMTPAQHLGNLTTPLSLLIVGISLAGAKTDHLLKDKLVIVGTAMRLLVLPGITCIILLALGVENPMLPALIMILMATPSPATAAALCSSNGGNEALAAKITFLTSLLCMLTIPLWATLF